MDTVVYSMNGLRIVDLSKHIDPATETRRCHLHRFNTGGPIPDFHTNVDIMTHLGTHAECPYHHFEDGPSVLEVPLTQFMGRAIYVVFDAEPNTYITAELLDKYCLPLMKDDTIVIIDSPHKLPPFTPKTNTEEDKRLFVNGETAQWFLDHKAKAIGFGDGVSIENRNEDVKPFHDILLAHNIIFIEVLKNLEKLEKNVFFFSCSPLPILGLDSSPVRAYAIEGLKEFSE